MTTFVPISVLVLVLLALIIVFALSLCKAAASGDAGIERAFYLDRLHKDMLDEAERLATLPQGHPTDEEEDTMTREQERKESCYTCEYRGKACNICPHMLLPVHINRPAPCDTCPYGPLESMLCMEHQECPEGWY
jgi:hypothetical protein